MWDLKSGRLGAIEWGQEQRTSTSLWLMLTPPDLMPVWTFKPPLASL
jgi:hypothetical protein